MSEFIIRLLDEDCILMQKPKKLGVINVREYDCDDCDLLKECLDKQKKGMRKIKHEVSEQ